MVHLYQKKSVIWKFLFRSSDVRVLRLFLQTAISFTQYAAYRSAANFKNPDKFTPERWLEDFEYGSDDKQAFQPFSFGSMGCLGKRYVNKVQHLKYCADHTVAWPTIKRDLR